MRGVRCWPKSRPPLTGQSSLKEQFQRQLGSRHAYPPCPARHAALDRALEGRSLLAAILNLHALDASYDNLDSLGGEYDLSISYGTGMLSPDRESFISSDVDLAGSFTDHTDDVWQTTFHAPGLEAFGYQLEADADAIIQRAIHSDICRR
jgi:hypothetical protein